MIGDIAAFLAQEPPIGLVCGGAFTAGTGFAVADVMRTVSQVRKQRDFDRQLRKLIRDDPDLQELDETAKRRLRRNRRWADVKPSTADRIVSAAAWPVLLPVRILATGFEVWDRVQAARARRRERRDAS